MLCGTRDAERREAQRSEAQHMHDCDTAHAHAHVLCAQACRFCLELHLTHHFSVCPPCRRPCVVPFLPRLPCYVSLCGAAVRAASLCCDPCFPLVMQRSISGTSCMTVAVLFAVLAVIIVILTLLFTLGKGENSRPELQGHCPCRR